MNNLAWLLVQDPDRPPHDPVRALPLARKAVEARPEDSFFLNTLGMALYRTGDWAGAAEALEKSIRFGKVSLPHDVLLLAMVRAKSGDLAEARTLYQEGLDRLKEIAKPDADLCALRDESAEVLGIRNRPKIRPRPKAKLNNARPVAAAASPPVIDGPRPEGAEVVPEPVVPNPREVRTLTQPIDF